MDTEVQVAIISAIAVEHQSIITIMTSRKTKYTNYTVGKINNIYCVSTQSGVGSLAVQRSVIDLMKYFKPKLLIFAGTAGSRNPNITVGDVVVSGYICARNSIYFSPNSVLSPYNAPNDMGLKSPITILSNGKFNEISDNNNFTKFAAT